MLARRRKLTKNILHFFFVVLKTENIVYISVEEEATNREDSSKHNLGFGYFGTDPSDTAK